MTEQEAVKKLRAYANENKCTLMETDESGVQRVHNFHDAFVIGWRDNQDSYSYVDGHSTSVAFFSFFKSPVDPPKVNPLVKTNFRHILSWIEG